MAILTILIAVLFLGCAFLAGFAGRKFSIALSDQARERRERREDELRSAEQRHERVKTMTANERSEAFMKGDITADEYLRHAATARYVPRRSSRGRGVY